jgi:hypothetical protein
VPGINSPNRPTNGIDDEDMDRIKQFLATPAWKRSPEMLCPEEQVR